MFPRLDWPKHMALVAGLMVSGLGVAVLVAWHLHFTPLIQVFPALAPMHRMTAVGFVLSGAALVFASIGRKRVARVLSLALFILSLGISLEYMLGVDLGIDQVLGRDYIRVRTTSPGRTSPVSTACFLCISVVLLTLTMQRFARYASAVAGVAGAGLSAVGTVTVLAYLLGNTEAYGWGHFTRVSLHSGSSLLLLGAGLLALAWRERTVRHGLPKWAPVSVALGLSAGVLGVWQAVMAQEGSDVPLLSSIVLGGGLLLALLLALAVYQAQKAKERHRELQKGQEALRVSEERFRKVFEEGPIGLALVGSDYRINKINATLGRMLGYSDAELTGKAFREITYPGDPYVDASVADPLLTGKVPLLKMEKRYLTKNGEIMWANVTASLIRDWKGNPLYRIAMIEDITERKRAERKLAEQAALLDLAHDAIIGRDRAARIIFWNRGAQDMYGWSAEEALGRVTHQLLQTRFPIPLQEIEARVLAQGRWQGELEHITREGKTIVVASHWSLRPDEPGSEWAILEINRDVTLSKRAEDELRALSGRLALATRAASIGIWEWDLRSNMTVWDDTVFEMVGIPKVVPMAYEEFTRRVHPDDLPKVQASLERVIAQKAQDSVEFRIIRPDGSVRHLSAAEGVVLDERGNVVCVVGTSVDITERKHLEAQIEASREQMVASARLSALGMMAGGVAHEINNPLSIIHAMASDLEEIVEEKGGVPPAVVTRKSGIIRETAERIAKIVKSLRQISREGAHDAFHPTRLAKILDETLEICRARFTAHGVKLLLPQAIPELSVVCRQVQIEQALLNLLQNAFDAVVENEGERWVRIEVATWGDSVAISVIDNGPGIPPELRSRIMEPFFTTKEVGKGTGLGLSLSKTIAEEHGGKLESGEDNGHTRFSLVLPMVAQAEAA